MQKIVGLLAGLVAFVVLVVLAGFPHSPPPAQAVVGELIIDQSVSGSSTLGIVTAQKLVDTASSTYFVDPAATGDSLVAAGKVTAGSFAGDGSLLTGISGIPAGLVSFFNLASCPTGWTDLTATYGGRYMVAKPTGGTLAGTVGTALTNLQNLTHTHSFTPAGSVSSSFSGSASTTGNGGVDHTHTGPSHAHEGPVFANPSGSGITFNQPTWTFGQGSTTYTTYYETNYFANTLSSKALLTNTAGTGATGGASAYSHTHSFTPAGTVSSSFTGSAGTSGASAGTDAPYIQLLACQKS